MNLRIAVRSLLRSRWRSVLTAGGIATAVALIVWTTAMMDAFMDQMIDSVTDTELGDAQITTRGYAEDKSIFMALSLDDAKLDSVRKIEGVRGASPRVVTYGLIGGDEQSETARVLGVDPAGEKAISSVPERVIHGAWLDQEPPADYDDADERIARQVVLGRGLAKQLGVGVGDELAVFLQAATGMPSDDKLVVVGLVASGSSALDRIGAWMHLADVQMLTALEGRAHEVVLSTERGVDLERVVADVRAIVSVIPEPDDEDAKAQLPLVRKWDEIVPELAQLVQMSESSSWIFFIVIYFVAALGVLNTQRMAALERQREFGILLAIGTTPRRLASQVLTESVLLTAAGSVLGGILGALATLYHQRVGMDLTSYGSEGGEGLSYMGVTFERLYFHFQMSDLILPFVLMLGVGILCGLWPAIKSARLDMPRAISGRT